VRDILREKIKRTSAVRGILFDGTPKMVGEARLVAELLQKMGRSDPLVIYLRVPVSETMRRVAKRGRKDDTRAAFLNRVAYYRKEVAQAVLFFRKIYDFRLISGVGPPPVVARKIERAIKKFQHDLF
jgi:adenylate kinase family enzyme